MVGMEWIYLAADKNVWQTLKNAVINVEIKLRVS
jgi:hypothetical protein